MEKLSDESLFSLWLSGNAEARNELSERYFHFRLAHCHKVAPLLASRLDSGDLNYVSFVAFQSAVDHYSLSLGSFLNYYLSVLGHEVIKKAKELSLIGSEKILSLDAPISGHDEEISLHDVVSLGEVDNPKIYLNYMEEASGLGCLPKSIDRRVLSVARLHQEGHSFVSIAGLMHETHKQVRSKYSLYKNFIEHGIKIGTFQGLENKPAYANLLSKPRPRAKSKKNKKDD
jgi:hypothetical protein